jgi:hypothetical protein
MYEEVVVVAIFQGVVRIFSKWRDFEFQMWMDKEYQDELIGLIVFALPILQWR